jgi:hypothetical protein
MSEEEKKPGITQIPLLSDMVLDPSTLPRTPKPPPRPRKKQVNFPPGYDPDTMDLFGELDDELDGSITEELKAQADDVIEHLVEEFRDEISNRLRTELSEQLAAILQDLHSNDQQDTP